MDMVLQGDADGIETASEISRLHDTPIIYLTDYGEFEHLLRARVTKSYGYILKPFSERELHICIESALYRWQVERNLKNIARWLGNMAFNIGSNIVVTDLQGLVVYLNTNAESLSGWTLSNMKGQCLSKILPDIQPLPSESVQDGFEIDFSGHRILKTCDGLDIAVDLGMTRLVGEANVPIGIVWLIREVSTRQSLDKEFASLPAAS